MKQWNIEIYSYKYYEQRPSEPSGESSVLGVQMTVTSQLQDGGYWHCSTNFSDLGRPSEVGQGHVVTLGACAA